MKRPSFQFYPADWRNSSNLRRCSLAARGAWIDILCILHDSDTYGLVHWPLKELADAAGVPMAQVRELVAKGVLKGCDTGACEPYVYRPKSGRREGEPVTLVAEQTGPVWFSSRMVKDEHVRQVRGGDTRFVGDGDDEKMSPKPADKGASKASPKPPFGDGSTSSSSSSTSVEHPPTPQGGPPDKPAGEGAGAIPCPYAAIVEAYHEALPELPRVKVMTEARQRAMRKRWGWVLSSRKADGSRRAETRDQALAWFAAFFARARDNDFLMGRTERHGEHAGWQCDLDFLLTDRGLKHVVEKTNPGRDAA